MRHDEIGIDPERRLVLGDRLLAPADASENIAEIVERAGKVGTQRDGAFRRWASTKSARSAIAFR
jgi:hypothetical protein